MLLVGTTQALHQQRMATPSILNGASSEDLGEEQAVLNLVGTTLASFFRLCAKHTAGGPNIV